MNRLFVCILIVALFACRSKSTKFVESVYIEKRDSICTISFSGDLMLHQPQLNSAYQNGEYNFDNYFKYIGLIWRKVDFCVVNLETTISNNGIYTSYPRFSSPIEILYALKKSGADVVALANNHIVDKGRSGVVSTLEAIDTVGLKSVGCISEDASNSNIMIMEKGNFRVALLNYTFSTNGLRIPKSVAVNMIDTIAIKNDILHATQQKATHKIIFLHWGSEYITKPNRSDIKLAKWCKSKGIDVVIGSHPHVVQPIDTINNIVYSLGNLVSNQYDIDRDCGLTVTVTLSHDEKPQIKPTIHWVDRQNKDKNLRYQIITKENIDKASNRKSMQKAIERVENRLYKTY